MNAYKWIKNNIHYSPLSIVVNLLVIYVAYMICRVEFVLQNWQLFGASLDGALCMRILQGGLRFDTAAIVYTNLPYLLLVMLPLHYNKGRVMQSVTKWVFVVMNSIGIIMNLMDSVYYAYSQRRTTVSIFQEFGNDQNMGGIIGIEFVNHWYLVLLAALMIYCIVKLYVPTTQMRPGESIKRYYIRQSVILLVCGPILVMGMRGNTFFRINRPISASEANEYVNEPVQAGIVMNTPFAFIRSSGRQQVNIPDFFTSETEMLTIYNPVHIPSDTVQPNHRNVVILLLESVAEEFIGAMYRPESGDPYETLTPFIDSLYTRSLTFDQSFANGWLSIDGIPVVQASLPKIFNPYIVSPYSLNETPGIAKELKTVGYTTAYFHGADDASLGLKASSRSTGIENYYGMSEYIDDSRFGGKKDYDGTWGIWDEKFLQFMCTKLGEMPQPFFVTWFSVNAHHPFSMPEEYKDIFYDKQPEFPIKKCISYTDMAVQKFFEAAKKQPWFDNTIFVLVADHGYRKGVRDSYRNHTGYYRIPIIFYDPSGRMPTGHRAGISQQIDIMPTLLNYLGYDKPYVSFGIDLLNTEAKDTWAFQYQDFPQFIKGDYMIEMNGFELSGVYRYKTDFRLEHNLLPSGDFDRSYVDSMAMQCKAILQNINTRLKNNTLRNTESAAGTVK